MAEAKKSKKQDKTVVFSFRVTEDERKQIEAAADNEMRPASQWARIVILNALRLFRKSARRRRVMGCPMNRLTAWI